MSEDAARFSDILTTATSIATYLNEPSVTPEHLALACEVLAGDRRLEDAGRLSPPLLPRRPGGPVVDAAVGDLVRRWYGEFGDIRAAVEPALLRRMAAEARLLQPSDTPGP